MGMTAVRAVRAPLWLLVLITISGTLAMHMFAPALPDAARSLGVGSAAMQMTITVYIMGLAGGQLVYGPLSDALGRRPMLMTGLVLYAAAGLISAFAPDVQTLIVARLFQALGGCAGLALGRAIVRDTAAPHEAVRDLALLNLMMTLGPGLAPIVGSGLTLFFGWRSIFVALAVLGSVTLLCTWRLLPETGRPTGSVRVAGLAHDYALLLRSPVFMGFAMGGGFATASIYAFIAAAPFIISTQLHRPLHEVGLYLGLLVVGATLGSMATRALAGRVRDAHVLLAVSVLAAGAAVALLLMTLLGAMTVAGVVGMMLLMTFGAAASSPVTMSRAMGVDARLVGSAAGLYGFMQMSIGALSTVAVGMGRDPAVGAATVLVGSLMLGLACNLLALSRSGHAGNA